MEGKGKGIMGEGSRYGRKDGSKTKQDSLHPPPRKSVKEMMKEAAASKIKKIKDQNKVNPGGS